MVLLTLGAAVLICLSTASALNIQHKPFLNDIGTFNIDGKGKALQAVTFSFAKHFQDHTVLQREPAKANIYGFSPSAGQAVSAKLVTPTKVYTYTTTVNNAGEWLVELDPQVADTTGNITVTSQGTTLSLTDVIFGDIWICSGQSNMQFSVNQMLDAAAEKADVNYPKIRLFTVSDKISTTPLDDLIQVGQAWTTPSANAIGGFSAVCWVFGKNIHKALGHSIGLIHSSWGGTPAEAWSSPAALAKCGNTLKNEAKLKNIEEAEILEDQNSNSVLWNAMIHPFLKTSIKGAIWYQGEADSGGTRQNHYNCTFPTMISDWRQNFYAASNKQTNPSFPFGFVQLAPNGDNNNANGFPDVRWHQTADVGYVPNPKMPNTFMAVAMDLPDFASPYGSIHPRDKKDVGDRLSLAGLAVAYGMQEVYQGPFPSKVDAMSNGVKITYGATSTLEIRNSVGFELLCTARWSAANISTSDSKTVTLANTCHAGETVKGIRYEWRESPCPFQKCAVYEKVNGIPGPPFVLSVGTTADGHSFIDFENELDV